MTLIGRRSDGRESMQMNASQTCYARFGVFYGWFFRSVESVFISGEIPITRLPNLPEPRPVFLQDALVHHHHDPGLAGFFGGFLVNHAFLQPDGRDLEP